MKNGVPLDNIAVRKASQKEAQKHLADLEPEIGEYFGQPDPESNRADLSQVCYYFHFLLPNTAAVIRYVAELTRPGDKVLDYGPAYGFYDIVLSRHYGLDITALEHNTEFIQSLCGLAIQSGIKVVAGTLGLGDGVFPEAAFDVVIMSHVIEHLRVPPLPVLRESFRILKAGGYMILCTPNVSRFDRIELLLQGKNIYPPFPDDLADGEHITDGWDHLREYTMAEVRELSNRAGFAVVLASCVPNGVSNGGQTTSFQQGTKMRLVPRLAIRRRLRGLLGNLVCWHGDNLILVLRKPAVTDHQSAISADENIDTPSRS